LDSHIDKVGKYRNPLKIRIRIHIIPIPGDQCKVGIIHMFKNGRVVQLDDTVGQHLICIPVSPAIDADEFASA